MKPVGVEYDREAHACKFIVWAPIPARVAIKTVSPEERVVTMNTLEVGYREITIEQISPETKYFYQLNDETLRPDPASHFQPDGVHGASQVVDHLGFQWQDKAWQGIPLPEMVFYEIHVGAFTPEGTFDAIVPRLDDLREIGINAIELMPVAQFPGERNWGYDGVYPFAVQKSYGGPEGLKRLVDACHAKGMAVVLDVVYNHLGPEGNYLADYGYYFTDNYTTPWGKAVNYDQAYSNEVRNFFINNALFWLGYYHIDALRIDAVHGIFDMSAKHFLEELAEKVDSFSMQKGKRKYLIAESDLNDSRIIRPRIEGGYSIDAQWCDDFHHALHCLITKEKDSYYEDFGSIEDMEKSITEGYVYSGQYSSYRKRNHGSSSKDISGSKFIVFSQNHDQVGNRMKGERLSTLISYEALKLTAGMVVFSPYIPLFFMGEEYGEDIPFLYFVSHSDSELIEAVREGRQSEFASFAWKGVPPDPQAKETFQQSKIEWGKRSEGAYKTLLSFYKEILKLRREHPALALPHKESLSTKVDIERNVISIKRWNENRTNIILCLFNFNNIIIPVRKVVAEGTWFKMIDSADKVWNGPGGTLPRKITAELDIVMPGESCALFAGG